MTPSVGRIVHINPEWAFEGECVAAIVTAVREDGDVSLAVFHEMTIEFQRPVGPDAWHWPERVDG